MFHRILRAGLLSVLFLSAAAFAQDKPNILVIWGDDVGRSNISAYTMGLVGYRTPNIDRVANEGMIFTDYYGEQSCTAGRSSYITGQSVFRTGLSKVGLPGAELGLREEDPTIAGLLKEQGYATGQFGKNHLGDRDEHLPTNHGFDEFFGNLYHLNAEEEPENEDYPGDMVLVDGTTFRETFGPRGVIRSTADGEIEDTGPLTKKRMETVDEETLADASPNSIVTTHDALRRVQAGLWSVDVEASEELVAMLKRNNRVGFEIAADSPPYHGIRGQGQVSMELLGDDPALEQLLGRYIGNLESSFSRWLLSRREDEYLIVIKPHRLFSWDYRQRMAEVV